MNKIKKDWKKKAHERYQNLSKEDKGKKWQNGRERYKNISEDEKQKLAEYREVLRNEEKWLIIVIRNYYYLKSNYLPSSFDEECKEVSKL